jgi:hypothetical protein
MKHLNLLIIGLLILTNGFAQINFPSSSDKPIWSQSSWAENWETGNIEYYYSRICLIGDTLINDTLYNKMYSLNDSILAIENASFIGGLREDVDFKVFVRLVNDKDRLLYNFKKEIGDTIWYSSFDSFIGLDYIVIESTDSVLLKNGEKRKRLNIISDVGHGSWIEGIGSTLGLLKPCEILMDNCGTKSTNSINCGVQGSALLCFLFDNYLIYKNCSGSCFPITTSITGVNNKDIKIYPNPAHDFVQIDYNDEIIKSVEILSITGLLLSKITYANKINIRDLNKGFYILRIQTTNDDKTITTRLIKN